MGSLLSTNNMSCEAMTPSQRANRYFGDTKNGKKDGKGKLYDENGDLVYDGEWKDDKRNGNGISYPTKANSERFIHEGDFKDDKVHGYATQSNLDKVICYDGEFKDGLYDGQGVLFKAIRNMDVDDGKPAYSGNFQRGMRHGYGISYDESDQMSYKGEWVGNMRVGEGIEFFAGSEIYVGAFKEDQRHGFGREFYFDGDCKYEGEWKDGKYDGNGSLFYEDDEPHGDEEYVGQWKNGLAHGNGKYYADKQLEYEGEWFEDKRHGKGTAYKDNQVVYSGLWEDDEPVKSKKRKEGKMDHVVEAKPYKKKKFD